MLVCVSVRGPSGPCLGEECEVAVDAGEEAGSAALREVWAEPPLDDGSMG